MPSVHARLQPSAAKRWLNCPGSVALCENVVDTGGAYADEGTACHEICERALNGTKPERLLGTKAQIGLVITEEMLALARPCIEWIEDYWDATGAKIHTEMRVEIGAHFGLTEGLCFGTSDVVGESSELLIADFKFGYNAVDASENDQLLLYTIGALHDPRLAGRKFDRVRNVILQPKCGDPTERVYTMSEFHDLVLARREKVRTAAKGGPLVPGSWCKESFCKARAVCPALQDEMVALAQREWANPLVHSPEELSDLLFKLELIESAGSALRAHAMKLIELGQAIPRWKIVRGDTKRAWLGEEKPTAEGLKKMGVDPFEKKLVSPAAAEGQLVEVLLGRKNDKPATKKAAKEIAKEMLKSLAGKPQGKPVLVPETDPRPALPPVFTAEDVKALEVAEID